MFKRVEKKRKKLEEEEELGIDEDMKEFMGFNDTDSDESASDSDSDSDEHSDADQLQSGEEDLEEEAGDEMEDVDASDDEEPPILLSEALRDPIYVVSLDPDVRACISCKGKVIKGTQMSTVHKASIAHTRRFERFKTSAAKCDPQSDAWQIARAVQNEASNSAGTQNRPDAGLSKRALKRSAKQASIKEKRTLHNKLRTKAIAKKVANRGPPSQDAAEKELPASKTLEPKSQKAGAASSDKKLVKKGERKADDKVHDVEKSDVSLGDKRTVKKGDRKPPGSKLQNVEKLDASPPKPLEPQKKKRKVQKDQVATPAALPQSPKRSQEKPLRKPKAPREKERTRAKAT
ncbi:uncharacterized protein BJ212DRAFT_1485064 [Suillus subaureus]|uniref:Uncharacterized protein n=1 Tax=Suillus subaureus TaxID=48587 RepID=A0A9P7J8K6_9AGAM|nr:uncharacterized protein BJ212DRAFT_1485064 [Suillus subaureus]KAG1808421.1 hypothetical protein BJ212DRAFT_1485064 [Suillus subaureus]